jgi:TolA-binding protein
MIKLLATVALAVTLSGCASLTSKIPSFSDSNQSARIIDVRQSVAQLDCKQPHAAQVKKISDNLEWFDMYSESKGLRQTDVRTLIKPMRETVDDFYKRSVEKEGSPAYCEAKKKIMSAQAEKAAAAVLSRF